MTERLHYTPEENEPSARLTLPNGEMYDATRENTTLFRYLGSLACFNHIHFAEQKDNETIASFYIFDHVKGYTQLKDFMEANNYPAVINQTDISGTDQDAYYRSATSDLHKSDTVPDGWE